MQVDTEKEIKQRKIVKPKRHDPTGGIKKGKGQRMEDEEEKDNIQADLQFEDSEDEWEDVDGEEEVVQRPDSDEDQLVDGINDDDWEDCDDSEDENAGQMQVDATTAKEK